MSCSQGTELMGFLSNHNGPETSPKWLAWIFITLMLHFFFFFAGTSNVLTACTWRWGETRAWLCFLLWNVFLLGRELCVLPNLKLKRTWSLRSYCFYFLTVNSILEWLERCVYNIKTLFILSVWTRQEHPAQFFKIFFWLKRIIIKGLARTKVNTIIEVSQWCNLRVSLDSQMVKQKEDQAG